MEPISFRHAPRDALDRTPEHLRRRAAELRLQARREADPDMAIILYRAAQAFEEAGTRVSEGGLRRTA